MKHPKAMTPRVVDNYFPDWMVKWVSNDLENFPVTYTNSPYKDFTRSRFFGNMLMYEDRWTVAQERWWFCLLYTSPSPRDKRQSRMPSSA